VRYVIESPYEQLEIDIDDVNVGRIIEQITANAAQHTENGVVQASYDYIGNSLVVTIRDTGEGMSEEVRSRLFERFASGPHTGTGLGLPICQELASQLGGHVDVSSEEGKGTTVWISIPAALISMKKQSFES
jgi:signal transduction histidine kinase